MNKIPLIKPEIPLAPTIKEIKRAFESGILTKGPNVLAFEKMIAKYVGTKYAFSTTSATTALHLSLVAMGVKQGDEVLVSDFTFPATANIVVQAGATPVLVDINLDTFNINFSDLEKKITPKTKAIICVDAFGNPINMKVLMGIAKKHNLKVIEDAACALGSRFGSNMSGGLADAGCFSFHPRKSITTGEGGMIVANDDSLAEKISILRNHGGVLDEQLGYSQFVEAGFNYRMSEVQAIMGISQMKIIEKIIKVRILIAEKYLKMLSGVKGITLPILKKGARHTFQSFVVLLDKNIDRDLVIKKMRSKGIETTLGTYALHAQPFFMRQYGYKAGNLNNSYTAFRQSLTLPLFGKLSDADLKYICASLIDCIKYND
ncbi:MAG: DegT/DnrJ/EryC1/StrS family aminotransferase [Candidatus Paceibacterota bacterium]